jgi:hypothetical protein
MWATIKKQMLDEIGIEPQARSVFAYLALLRVRWHAVSQRATHSRPVL